MVPDELTHQGFGLRRFGQHHQAAGAGIQPMAQLGGRPLAAVLRVVQGNAAFQIVLVAGALAGQPGGLVDDQQLIVLIHRLGRAAGTAHRAFAVSPVQHVIQNEQPNLIAVLHPSSQGLLLSVQLDLVFPQGLVQAAQPQGGELVHQVLVQPNRNQAAYFNHSHAILSNSLPCNVWASGMSSVTISQPASLSSMFKMG